MSTEPRPEPAEGTGAPDDAVARRAARPSAPPDAAVEVSPSEQRATDPWVQAADPSGALRATKDMPEPDSLGG